MSSSELTSILNLESNLFIYDRCYGLVEINPEYQPKGILDFIDFKKNKSNESLTFEYAGNTYTIFRTEKKAWVMKENLNKVMEYARRSMCYDRICFY